MADQNETQVKITGDGTSAAAAMKQASSAVTDGVASMKASFDSIGGAFAKLQGHFAMLVGIVAGGKFFKDAIAESNKLTGETMRLSRSLGISAEEANTLNTALGDINSDSDTYIGSFQKFAQQLRRNEEGLQAMGLKTRDANGHLREANDVYREAISMVGQYKPGLDQTTAAQQLFGKSIDDVMKLQKLNNDVLEEARLKNEELGLVITEKNVAASKAYKAAMNDVGDVMSAVMKTIGDAVMPAFTELAQYLASTGPYVVNVFKGALTGLMLVFRAVQAVVKSVAAVIFEFISTTIDQVGNLSELISNVLSGNWDKAADAAVRMKDRTIQAFRNIKAAASDAFTGASDKFAEDLDNLWGPKKASTSKPKGGTKTQGDLKEGKSGKDESRLPVWEADLSAQKVAFEKANDLREMSKQAEFQYWQELLQRSDLTSKERVSITKKTSEAELAVMREQRVQMLAISEEAIEAYKHQQLDELASRRQDAQAQVDIGRMTQLQMLQLDEQMEEERFRITKEAVTARLELLSRDPTKNAAALLKLNDELAAIEREHQMKQRGIQQGQFKEQFKDWQGFFNSIGSAFGNVVQGLVTRTMTMGQAVKSLFSGLLAAVGNFLAQMIAKRVAAWAVEKTMALAGIASNAAQAGSGAAASQASIPYAGPVLALAAMAAVFAGVMGMQSNVPSAAGGFDIPAGLNPLTQLHEREMVLPAKEADTIRSLGSDVSGAPIHIHASGGDYIHKNDLATLLRKMKRNFQFV